MKTRDRILQTSLDLFNDQGERAVTTNHIAAAMNISTGNLYYHFRNKREIISELFRAYENRVRGVLNLPEERSAQITDMQFYLTEIFRGLWE
ncbi:MAG TPA: TetR family transcriptional regulator, partial [Oceanospirillales bacterium]|nr:TetR family transcriptional regulator [Oceanospirillales bacterium]